MIRIQTSLGVITLNSTAEHAPATTASNSTCDGFYAGTIFHRVIPELHGPGRRHVGGHEPEERAPIRNEAKNGLKNARGSIARMAAHQSHSAFRAARLHQRQDNGFLDHPGHSWGYCVFGKGHRGHDVVDTSSPMPTANKRGHQNDAGRAGADREDGNRRMKATLFVADLHLDAAARLRRWRCSRISSPSAPAPYRTRCHPQRHCSRPGSATTTTAKPASRWPRRWAACSAAACPRTSCTATAISCSARTMRRAGLTLLPEPGDRPGTARRRCSRTRCALRR